MKKLSTTIILASAAFLLTGCSTTPADNVITPNASITAVPSQYVAPIELDFNSLNNETQLLFPEGTRVALTNIQGDVSLWEGTTTNPLVANFIKGNNNTEPATLPEIILYNAGTAELTLKNSETGQEIKIKIVTEPLNKDIKQPAPEFEETETPSE